MCGNAGIRKWMDNGSFILFTGSMLAFVLPFGKAYVPFFIGLFVFSVIVSPGFGKLIPDKKVRNYLLLIILFYLIHVIGLLWSGNLKYAFSDLEIKASLILLPLVFLFSPLRYYNSRFVKTILVSLLLGCFISVLISGIIALGLYSKTGDIWSFYYTGSSYFMHTSYLALYIVFVLYALYTIEYRMKAGFFVFYFTALFLVFYLNLLSSKAGIITFGIAMVFILTETLLKRNWKSLLVYFIVPVAVFLGSVYFFPVGSSRVVSAMNTMKESAPELNTTGESTADRILIWKAALDLSKENILIGTGTGDVKDELINAYNENGLIYPVQLNLNAHNQFIQSFVALGIPALLSLLAMLVIPLWISFRKRKWLYFGFICFFSFNILVESMLEVQAGIIFYVFWNIILWIDLNQGQTVLTEE